MLGPDQRTMIKAIIFDCFGVVYSDKFDLVYEHFGGDLEKDAEFIEDAFFRASKGQIESGLPEITERLGVTESEWREYQDAIRGFNEELLVYIKKLRNHYKVGMLSNIGNNGLVHHLDYRVLEEHFDSIIESAKIGFAKPEAQAYQIAASSLGVRLDESVFIDDRQNYVDGAIHVGMRAVLYKDLKQLKRELKEILL